MVNIDEKTRTVIKDAARKSTPLKKIPEVDEIFDNVHKANMESDNNPESLRISTDSKAGVKIGELSGG